MSKSLIDKQLKEFYARFTHDWSPQWYTKEEAPNHPIDAGKFLVSSMKLMKEEMKKEIRNKIVERMKKYADTPLDQRRNAFNELADFNSSLGGK